MTTQPSSSATIRETHSEYRNRPIIVEVHAAYLVLRLKGTQTKYSITYDDLADLMEMRAAKQLKGDIPARKGR